MQQDDELKVDCPTHGRSECAVVCGHLVNSLLNDSNKVLGFVENSSIPGDLQGWCDDCEQFFLQEKEMTETFKSFTKVAVVCEQCYLSIRDKHSTTSIHT